MKKDILTNLIKYEINCEIDNVTEMIKADKFPKIKSEFLPESAVRCWLESEPSDEEKKEFLIALGYEL